MSTPNGSADDPDEVPFSVAPGSDTLRELDTLGSAERPGNAPFLDSQSAELVLTILHHPDMARLGEQAQLGALEEGRSWILSRIEPGFGDGTRPGRPLLDPYLSRRPLKLAYRREELLLPATEGVHLQRADSEGPLSFSRSELERGVEFTLGKRVVLLASTSLPRGPRHGLVGSSVGLEQTRRGISRVADLHIPVLVRGETGVGKEKVAEAIHAASSRGEGPFVAINMATVSRETAGAELFGHAKGAFTGAHQRRVGLFEQASGGTLFLDEVAELGVEQQAMLLRVLETGKVRPLGDRSEIPVDVRLISATDAPLEALVERGEFRAPLLHRLAGFVIHVPPLRERQVDIPSLVLHFLRAALQETGELSRLDKHDPRAPLWFSPELMLWLMAQAWPGNVRQLGNAVRQLVVANRGAGALQADAHFEQLFGDSAPPSSVTSETPAAPKADSGPRRPGEISDDELIEALQANDWAAHPTARALGIPRSTLYGLIERCPKVRRATDLSQEEIQKALDACEQDQAQASRQLGVSRRALQFRIRELELG